MTGNARRSVGALEGKRPLAAHRRHSEGAAMLLGLGSALAALCVVLHGALALADPSVNSTLMLGTSVLCAACIVRGARSGNSGGRGVLLSSATMLAFHWFGHTVSQGEVLGRPGSHPDHHGAHLLGTHTAGGPSLADIGLLLVAFQMLLSLVAMGARCSRKPRVRRRRSLVGTRSSSGAQGLAPGVSEITLRVGPELGRIERSRPLPTVTDRLTAGASEHP